MKIVVPVPLNSEMEIPIMQAVYFAQNYGAQITILHVTNEHSKFATFFSPHKRYTYRKKIARKLKQYVKARFANDPVFDDIKFKVKSGELVTTILGYAAKSGADLIIIKKAKQVSGRRRLWKQENADRLIANSTCPVFTIYKLPTYNGINKILLPVDIIKKTDNKVAWAKSMAKIFGAEIKIVSVMNMNIKRDDSLAYQKGRRIEQEMRREGINAELVLLRTDERSKEDLVLEYAETYRPDLLLIMTHQENLIVAKYLGNFARQIIHKAEMPVLSMIPNSEDIFNGLIDSLSDMSGSKQSVNGKHVSMRSRKKYSEA